MLIILTLKSDTPLKSPQGDNLTDLTLQNIPLRGL